MIGRKRGDYLLPLVFFEKPDSFRFRGVIINLTPDAATVVTNDRRFLSMQTPTVQQKEYTLEFNFFELDTGDIRARIIKSEPGLFKGHEMLLVFEFVKIGQITRRDINRIIQAQRLN